jgi:hypothetical protein
MISMVLHPRWVRTSLSRDVSISGRANITARIVPQACSPPDDERGGSLFSILSGFILAAAKNSGIAPHNICPENFS